MAKGTCQPQKYTSPVSMNLYILQHAFKINRTKDGSRRDMIFSGKRTSPAAVPQLVDTTGQAPPLCQHFPTILGYWFYLRNACQTGNSRQRDVQIALESDVRPCTCVVQHRAPCVRAKKQTTGTLTPPQLERYAIDGPRRRVDSGTRSSLGRLLHGAVKSP